MALKQPELTGPIIAAAIEVHRELGPDQPEAAYQEALAWALSERRVRHRTEVALPLEYEGLKLDCGYRLDVLVENAVVVELKSVEALVPIHTAQVLTYLRLGGWRFGLLLNFNVMLLKQGIRRIVCDGRPSWEAHPERSPASSEVPAASAVDGVVEAVLEAALRVHAHLGPGLLASSYEVCMQHELCRAGVPWTGRVAVPLRFKGGPLLATATLDLLVDNQLPILVRALDAVTPVHLAHMSALLRHGGWSAGLLLNFNVQRLKDGVRRCFSHPPCSPSLRG